MSMQKHHCADSGLDENPANENLVAPGLVIFDKSFNDKKAFLRSISTSEKANTRENSEIGSKTVEPVQQTRSGCAQQC